jgi:hypothetical protein
MNELLSPLSKDKKGVMKELLESVQTRNLQGAYNKYLPSVLNEAVERRPAVKPQLNEATLTSKNGNRAVVAQVEASTEEASELQHILSLAGIRK